MKRDVLLEATDDLWYICHILDDFREASAEANRDAVICAVRLVEELVEKGLCVVAMFSKDPAKHHDVVDATHDEIVAIVEHATEHAFDHFLVATDLGRAWVSRYDALVSEL